MSSKYNEAADVILHIENYVFYKILHFTKLHIENLENTGKEKAIYYPTGTLFGQFHGGNIFGSRQTWKPYGCC